MQRNVRILLSGRVQGVFFRDYTQRKARSLSLNGIVRNLPTGEVEIEAQGNTAEIEALIQWCWEGSPLSAVSSVNVEERPLDASLTPFSIDY